MLNIFLCFFGIWARVLYIVMDNILQLLGEPGTGGSSTPSMVGSVKKWQTSEPQKSSELWRILAEANSALETQLNLLSRYAEEQWETYKCVIGSCSGLHYEQVIF